MSWNGLPPYLLPSLPTAFFTFTAAFMVIYAFNSLYVVGGSYACSARRRARSATPSVAFLAITRTAGLPWVAAGCGSM